MKPLYIQLSYLTALCFLNLTSIFANDVIKTSPQKWVRDIAFVDENIKKDNGGSQYLLIDTQDHIPLQSTYRHYAVKVTNADGVQSMSDINVNFDPSYQKLKFHKLRISRNGQLIDKLQSTKIKLIQREESMEKALYDGSLSAVIHLSDVREQDVIEYAYTIIGYNPINNGNYTNTYYHQFSQPINRIFNRIIVSPSKDIQIKYKQGATQPNIIKGERYKEYLWDVEAQESILYDNNVPSWVNIQKRFEVTTFKNWNEVVRWALPLYKYSTAKVDAIKESLNLGNKKKDNILKLIRLVQNEVRYLGLEAGIGAYKPNAPSKVYKQRYGDCKDKSLLLVALLRSEGIEAYPLLVNSYLKQGTKEKLPSNQAFDHCVVQFEYRDKSYFIDPTISDQGGNIDHIYFPNYKTGLLVKAGENQLIEIPDHTPAKENIKEYYSLDSIGGNAHWMVRTEYTGRKADNIRNYFSTTSLDKIKKEYLNYYSNLYPTIESDDEVKIYDNEKNTTNKVIVEEYYRIKDFWSKTDKDDYLYVEIYPLVMESRTDFPKSATREQPYVLGAPYEFTESIKINLPEEWTIEPEYSNISGDGFNYQMSVSGYGKKINITHKYNLTKEYILGDSVGTFLKQHGEIQKNLSYFLTYNKELSGFKISWLAILLTIASIGVGIYFGSKLYKEYDPEPWEFAENKGIGGWLILPAIMLVVSPFSIINDAIDSDYFNHNLWMTMFEYDVNIITSVSLFAIVGMELIYNILFSLFSILLVILFFQRRTSVPRLISIFYVMNFSFPIVESIILTMVAPDLYDLMDTETMTQVGRGIISAAIWVPYFNVSEKVKSTFCKTYKTDKYKMVNS